MMDKEKNIKLASGVAVAAGAFTLVVALMFLINYLNISQNDPVSNEALEALVQRLSQDSNNQELIGEIRQLDLLARKAFFTAQWQINVGSWLMLIGAILTAVALRVYFSLKSKIDEPEQTKVKAPVARIISQKWISGLATIIVILALVASLSSSDYLDKYDEIASVQTETKAEESDIIVVNVPAEPQQVNGSPDSVQDKKIAETDKEVHEEKATTQLKEAEKVIEKTTKTEQDDKTLKAEKPLASTFASFEEQKKQHHAFRGFWGQGISFAHNTPVNWNVESGENIKWTAEIPVGGFNSPVIWEDKVFLTGANPTQRVVYCYSRIDGSLLWQHVVDNVPGSPAKAPKTTDDTGLAAPSVCTDGERVYAIFGTGDIIALKTDGTRLWAKNLGVPDNHYGHSSSLLCLNEKLFVQYDTNDGGRLLALKVFDGSIIWDVKREANISWASPVIAELNGTKQLVLTADPIVAGYDIENGNVLWSVECMMGEIGPSVGIGEGLVFAGNEYATLAAIDPAKSEIVWEDNEYLPEVSSPLCYKGLLYIATTYGVLVCYDAKSGEKQWEMEFDNGFYSSPMAVEDKVYIVDMEGIVHIVKAGSEAELIASNAMGEPVMSTPSFANGELFLRSVNTLYCIGE